MNAEEKHKLREEIRDFRYSIVGELCDPYLEPEQKKALIKEKSLRTFKIPGSKKTTITADTIKNWERRYRTHGKDGLLPKWREDRGRPRSFGDVEAQAIIDMLEKYPKMTATSVVQELQKKGVIKKKISRTSLSRFVEANGLKRKDRIRQKEDRSQLRFGFEFPLQCVQADAMHAFPIPDGDKGKKKAILLAFIDDATRRIVYGKFAFSEKSILFEHGIKHILQSHGRISMLYTDNGSTFVSEQTKRIVESLGIRLIHSRPYKPQGRGKIERFFRTVRECFLNNLEPENIHSLDQLNNLFSNWLELEYHRRKHRILDATPNDVWLSKARSIKRIDPFIDLDTAFYHRTTRRVYSDSIVSIDSVAYQVPSILIGKSVEVSYDPNSPLNRIYVSIDGKDYGEARPVDILANRKVKRNREFSGELEIAEDEVTLNGAAVLI